MTTTADSAPPTAPTATAPTTAPSPTSAAPPPSDPQAPPATAAEPHPNAPPGAITPPAPATTPAAEQPKDGAMKVQPPPDLPFEPRNFAEAYRWARWGAATRFVAPQVRDRPDDVMFLIMLGRRWGLDVVASLQIYVIDGKPSLPAAHMVGIVKASRLCNYFDPTVSTMERAEWATQRVGKGGTPGREILLDYTIAEAEQMGLLSKGRTEASAERNQWNRQPRTMLRWRAATSLARLVYPDLLTGMYSVEEMVDVLETKGGKVDIVEVARADIDKAKDALWREGVPPIVRDLRGLPEPAAPDEMDKAMAAASTRPAATREAATVARGSTTSRVAQRAAEAHARGGRQDQTRRDQGPPVRDMFADRGGPGSDDELASCERCQLPIAQGQILCAACASE